MDVKNRIQYYMYNKTIWTMYLASNKELDSARYGLVREMITGRERHTGVLWLAQG
jgi:hypothetical protein